MKNKKIYLAAGLVIIVLIVIVISIIVIKQKQSVLPVDSTSTEQIYYEVESGTDALVLSQELESEGIIKSSDKLYDMFLEEGGSLYVNSYVLSPSMTLEEVYNTLTSPISNIITDDSLLIYEGETLDQVAVSLAEALELTEKEVLTYWSNPSNLNTWIAEYEVLTDDILAPDIKYPLEGYLYPATYDIIETDDLETMTKKILDQTEAQYLEYKNMENTNGLTFHESLTLASIVQRETIFEKDKPIVAGVFYNRIEAGMPLQSDITVLYALGEHKEIVTYDDLEVDSPYNTYLNSGLPPGPISSVYLKDLDAVYNPEDNDYLYFFAKKDTGEVLYSSTLEEHEAISEEYAWE